MYKRYQSAYSLLGAMMFNLLWLSPDFSFILCRGENSSREPTWEGVALESLGMRDPGLGDGTGRGWGLITTFGYMDRWGWFKGPGWDSPLKDTYCLANSLTRFNSICSQPHLCKGLYCAFILISLTTSIPTSFLYVKKPCTCLSLGMFIFNWRLMH